MPRETSNSPDIAYETAKDLMEKISMRTRFQQLADQLAQRYMRGFQLLEGIPAYSGGTYRLIFCWDPVQDMIKQIEVMTTAEGIVVIGTKEKGKDTVAFDHLSLRESMNHEEMDARLMALALKAHPHRHPIEKSKKPRFWFFSRRSGQEQPQRFREITLA